MRAIRILAAKAWRRFWWALGCDSMAQCVDLLDPWWAILRGLAWAFRIRDSQEGEPWKTGWWCWPWRHTKSAIACAAPAPGTWRHRIAAYHFLQAIRHRQRPTAVTLMQLQAALTYYTRDGAAVWEG